MKKTIIAILLLVSLQSFSQNRDTTMVLATYQIGNTFMARSSIVYRIHLDTTISVIDSAKSTLKNIQKKLKKIDFIYYIIPYQDTIRVNGKVKLDSLGKSSLGLYFNEYPAEKVSELETNNGSLIYLKTLRYHPFDDKLKKIDSKSNRKK